MIYATTARARGFGLIEIVIALFIMSVTILFVTLVAGTVKVTRDSLYENVAFRAASNKVNELRAGGYANLPVDGTFSDTQLATLPQSAASTTISVWNTKTKKVLAGVSWRGADNATRYVSVTTLITESGGL